MPYTIYRVTYQWMRTAEVSHEPFRGVENDVLVGRQPNGSRVGVGTGNVRKVEPPVTWEFQLEGSISRSAVESSAIAKNSVNRELR